MDQPLRPSASRSARRPEDSTGADTHDTLTTTSEHQATEFVYTTYIKTTPEQLWQALTDPAFTSRYWGVELTSDWKVGSTITWEYKGVTMADPTQTVLVADANRRLSYNWHAITPEFGALVGSSADEVAALAAERRSNVSFEIEPIGRAGEAHRDPRRLRDPAAPFSPASRRAGRRSSPV